MIKKLLSLFLYIFSYQALALENVNFKLVTQSVGSSSISFVVNEQAALNEKQEEKFYSQKVDFARLEKLAPLRPADLAALKANDFRNLTMEQFNQIYARLSSGPMPLGDYAAYIMQKPPIYSAIKGRLLKQIKGATQFASFAKTLCGREAEDCLFEFLWKGKRFNKKNDLDQIEADTTFNPVAATFKFSDLLPGFLRPSDKVMDFAEGVVNSANLTFFPMNTYCGISQIDTRRESIIVDAGFADDFPKYMAMRDEIITRKNLNLSEEFRMVRPGLYIGRVYTNKVFIFNVVLEKTGTLNSMESANACFDGTKTR